MSGEVFTASAGRAARETLATFPGARADSAEEYLEQWNDVMGIGSEPYLATSTLEHVRYTVKQAHGLEMEDIPEFGIHHAAPTTANTNT